MVLFMCTHLKNTFKTIVNHEWMRMQDLISYVTLFTISHIDITELRSFIPTSLHTSTGNGYTYHEGMDTHSDKGGSFVHNRNKEVH